MAAAVVPFAQVLAPSWTGRSWHRLHDDTHKKADVFYCEFNQDEQEGKPCEYSNELNQGMPLHRIYFSLAGRAMHAFVDDGVIQYTRNNPKNMLMDDPSLVYVKIGTGIWTFMYNIHDGTPSYPILRDDFWLAAEALFVNDAQARAARCSLSSW